MATAIAKPQSRKLRPLFGRPLENIREEFDELVSRVFGGEGEQWLEQIRPSLDLAETDSTVEVRLDAPGMEAKDINVQVNGNLLTISGQRNEEREEKGKTYHRVEHGILTVKLPKTEESKAHKIQVKT